MGNFPLVEQPFAASLDFCIHRIRGQVQFTRPRHYAVNNMHLLELGSAGQVREDAPKETRQELDATFQPVLKTNRQCEVANNPNLCNVPFHRFTPKGQSVLDSACLGIAASLPAIRPDATQPNQAPNQGHGAAAYLRSASNS